MNANDCAAFPTLERGGNGLDLTAEGMTLRDYFAAKAMLALVSAYATDAHSAKGIAESSYEYADAMLEARARAAREGEG